MATITRRIGPSDHGQRLTLDEFIEADFEEGWLYELARGVIDVTEVPGPHHGRIVRRLARHVRSTTSDDHPGVINYRAGGGECRLRLPGMQSDRHPDQAVYLDPEPPEATSPGRDGSRTSSSRWSAEGARSEITSRSARSISAPA